MRCATRREAQTFPQGSPLSPLLANIYMRRFVLGWKMFGLRRAGGEANGDAQDDERERRNSERLVDSPREVELL